MATSVLQSIKDRVCLVSGGGGGLGEATVRRFLDQGAKVAILDVERSKGAAIAAEYPSDRCIFTPADVTKEEQVAAAVKKVKETFGALHIVINNAGIWNGLKPVYDFTKDEPCDLDWVRKVVEVNLFGNLNVTRHTVGLMAKNEPNANGEKGIIIMTSSINAEDSTPYQVGYVASKGAVYSMTQALAAEFSDIGIRVNTVLPGNMQTNIVRHDVRRDIGYLRETGHVDLVGQTLPKTNIMPRRQGKPEEFAYTCQMICENAMFNGAKLRMDGLLRIHPQVPNK